MAEARERLEAIAAAERSDANVDPANGSRWWFHPEVADQGVVLLHGYTNNPRQYVELGRQLFDDGHNVIALRFPYHGYRDRMTTAHAALTMADVVGTTVRAVEIAALAGRRVDTLGISVGGTLAAWAVGRLAIDTAVVISPFFGLKPLTPALNGGLARALERLPNTMIWWDPIHHAERIPQHAYPRFSTKTLGRMMIGGEDVGPASAVHGRRVVLVVNAREPTINNRLALERCRVAGDGPALEVVRKDDFPAQHDVIEPQLKGARIDVVYPVLRQILAATERR
jgi:alpha-beta hydrolase superfamily lysophospholipase